MRRFFLLTLTAAAAALPITAAADLTLSGAIRNDALTQVRSGTADFYNQLETQLVLQRSAEAWRFYSDLRLRVLSGDLTAWLPPDASLTEEVYQLHLLRAFIRYDSGAGILTLGKTYATFGVTGVFNPFELDRSVNVSDLAYTKSGVVGVTYDTPLSDLSGVRAFIGPTAGDVRGGASLSAHWGTFDFGAVAFRLSPDEALTGVYFQGDLELGVQGAWAYHPTRDQGPAFHEAVLGVDYSFFDGELTVMLQAYYNGDDAPESSRTTPAWSSTTLGAGFVDPGYLYANLTFRPDEFFQVFANALINLTDHSSLLLPGASWILADGLTLTTQLWLPTGTGTTQYSRDSLGTVISLVRLEAKL